MKQYFLIIFSSESVAQKVYSSNYFIKFQQIISNCYVGEIENNQTIPCVDVRKAMVDINNSNVIVIRLDADISSAWYLSESANEYLTNIFSYIHDGSK